MWRKLRRDVFLRRACLKQAFQRGGSSSREKTHHLSSKVWKIKDELRGAQRVTPWAQQPWPQGPPLPDWPRVWPFGPLL
jgi:hypothetical protein